MKTPRQSIKLEEEQRQLLEEWVRAHRTPQQVVKRCQIILRSAEGKSDEAIAKELDINRHTCRLWRERFTSCGADCLWEVEAGRGRKSQAGLAQRIIEATLHSKPAGQTHWTTRKMAKEQVRAAAKKSGKSGGLQNRMKSWPVSIAKAHRFLAVMFRYGLSCGSWSLQL